MSNKKTKKIAKVLAFILAAALLVTSFSFVAFVPGLMGTAETLGAVAFAAEKNSTDTYLDQELSVLKAMLKQVHGDYKDNVSYETLLDGAFSGVFEALDDPYSVYYATEEEGESFMEDASAEFSGIGVSIEQEGEYCRVVTAIPNTPAERAGLRTGDIIQAVDGVSLKGKTLSEMSALMKGPVGTKVSLVIDRSGKSMTLQLTREKIQNITVYSRMLDNYIGYIQITQFGAATDKEFQAARLKLLNEGMKGLVVDVRSNPGGIMDVAVSVASQLMKEGGPVVHYAQKGTILETLTAEGSLGRQVPTVMLINEGSASASEALAGAMKDTGSAVLVGTTTYGKGVAQQVMKMSNGTAYKLSMFYFLTPNKHQIDKEGISPDYTVYNGLGLTSEKLAEIYDDLAPMTEKVKYKAGETGLNVYGAQQRLEYLGYDVDVNGAMDAKTVEAIKKFQKQQGFSAYGGLDYTTMGALEKAFAAVISGDSQDKQLEKAVELLTNSK